MTSGRHIDREFVYGAFLFATIEEDDKGPLSVISALARLDIEPWDEAALLSKLPRPIAAERLRLLLARLPGSLPACRDPETANRLVALLPQSAFRRNIVAFCWFLTFLIIVLIAFLGEIVSHAHHPSAHGKNDVEQPTRPLPLPKQ